MGQTTTDRGWGWLREVTRYQWMVFLVAWLGWSLDNTDFNLFSLVLRPAVTELLGGVPTAADIGRVGGILSMTGLLGWALGGFCFGIVGDSIGRVRTLTFSVVLVGVCTALQGLTQSTLTFGICRFLTGVGTGAEVVVGIPLVAEAFADVHRAKVLGVMMTGGGFGSLIGGQLFAYVGPYGWRYVMLAGVAPALILLVFAARSAGARAVPGGARAPCGTAVDADHDAGGSSVPAICAGTVVLAGDPFQHFHRRVVLCRHAAVDLDQPDLAADYTRAIAGEIRDLRRRGGTVHWSRDDALGVGRDHRLRDVRISR